MPCGPYDQADPIVFRNITGGKGRYVELTASLDRKDAKVSLDFVARPCHLQKRIICVLKIKF